MEVMDGMPKSRIGVTNVMLALAISLLINFSYLLILFESKTSDDSNIPSELSHRKQERVVEIDRTGVLNIMPDGYGYIVYPAGGEIDSVYVHSGRIWRYGLHNGDRMVVSAEEPRKAGAHHSLEKVYSINGKPFEYESRFDKPNSASQTTIQIISYWVLTFLLLTILTLRMRKRSWQYYASRYTACLLLVALFYFVAPTLGIRGDLPRGMIDIMLILKCSFVLVVAVLYGRIYGLLYQRQRMVLEYEQLKNENLSTRYRVLMSQISPHFLFNSLNSLSMLVREKYIDSALNYIDRLSYVFRYIIQNGENTLTPLSEELKFVDAYRYLLEVRYADKLFFDIEVDRQYCDMLLPALSLQPLIENAVKHNSITRAHPFRITIRTDGACVVVSNPIIPKMTAEQSTGIGLKNLSSRWQLIANRDIQVIRTDDRFEVRLPLISNNKSQDKR